MSAHRAAEAKRLVRKLAHQVVGASGSGSVGGRKRHRCLFGAGACRRPRERKSPLLPEASWRLRGRDSNPNFLVQSQASCR